MVAVGTKVRIIDLADHLLDEGIVQKISDRRVTVKFPNGKREYEYDIDDLEEVMPEPAAKKIKGR